MSNLFDENEKIFSFSKQPRQLESYKCFHDPSRARGDFIDGEELLRIKAEAQDRGEKSERIQERANIWYYFYRPYNYGHNIASVQKNWIEERGKQIILSRSRVTNNSIYLGASLFLSAISLLMLVVSSISLVFMIVPSVICFNFFYERSIAKEKISKLERENEVLAREVDHLLNQKYLIDREIKRLRKGPVMDLFWRNIKSKERGYLKTFSDKERRTVERNALNFYLSLEEGDLNWKTKDRPETPVIPSWALLQSSESLGGLSLNQDSGLKVAAKKIQERVATWRGYHNGEPIFRLWYIPFIFFFDKYLSIISFYYDFVEDRIYSQNIEVFQYNHITNYSFIDEDISFMRKEKLPKRLPKKFKKNIFSDEVKTISLSSASGASYRSVIPDADVNAGLNKWLDNLMDEQINSGEKDVDTILDDGQAEFIADLKHERLMAVTENEKHSGLIETLALLTFKKISHKVAEFSLSEHNEWSIKKRLREKTNRAPFQGETRF